jgi:hypothetical protein
MDEPILPVLDTEPKSGVYVDHDDVPLSEEDAELGRALGEAIDVDVDDDNGLDRL